MRPRLQKRLRSGSPAADQTTIRPGAAKVRVLPGEVYTSASGFQSMVTILGSCVAACIRDPVTGFGGMNHFMLPTSTSGDWNGTSSAGRYGNFAMDSLIAAVTANGCPVRELEIKIFGGADLYRGAVLVGSRNVEFIGSYLARIGVTPAAMDLGGTRGRKIHFTPATGLVLRQLIKPHTAAELVELERKCQVALDLVSSAQKRKSERS